MIRRLILAAVLLSACPAGAEQITFNPDKDNTLIQQTDPNAQLSNGLGDVFLGRTNQDGQNPATISIRRALLHFDISAIPAGSTITSVTLSMNDVMGLNGDHPADLHRVLADWGEGTSFQGGGMGAPATQDDATWLYRFYNFASPGSSPAWTNPGGDFSPTVSGSTIISDDFGANQIFTWSSTPQMIADVQSWLDDSTQNFGWLIQGNEAAGQTAKRLNGRHASIQPLLTIEYSLAVVPEPSSFVLLTLGGAILATRRKSRRRSSHDLN